MIEKLLNSELTANSLLNISRRQWNLLTTQMTGLQGYLRFGLWLKLMEDWGQSLSKLVSAENLFTALYHPRAIRH